MKKKCTGIREAMRHGFSRGTIIPLTFTKWLMGKKGKQSIYSLQEGGRVIAGDEALLKHATEYYRVVWSGVGDMLALDPDLWADKDKVTMMENQELVRLFEEEEIRAALFHMEENKAAGPDGFPIEFYQAC
jgi:hypothetical protein